MIVVECARSDGRPTRAWWRVQPRLLTLKRGQFLQQKPSTLSSLVIYGTTAYVKGDIHYYTSIIRWIYGRDLFFNVELRIYEYVTMYMLFIVMYCQ